MDCYSALKRTPCHTQQRERTWRTSGSRRARPLQSCPTLRLCGTQPTRLLCPRRFSRREHSSGSPLCDVKEARQSRANPARSHLLWNLKRRRELPQAQEASGAREGNTETIWAASGLRSFSRWSCSYGQAPGPSRQWNEPSGQPCASWPGLPSPPAGADVPQRRVSITAFREGTEEDGERMENGRKVPQLHSRRLAGWHPRPSSLVLLHPLPATGDRALPPWPRSRQALHPAL